MAANVTELSVDLELPAPPVIASDLLFVEVPELVVPGRHKLSAEYRIEGQPAFLEVLRLDVPESVASPVVELLAWFPEKRQMILGQGPIRQVEVVLTFDEEQSRILPLVELVEKSSRLTSSGISPLAAVSENLPPSDFDIARILAEASSCTQQGCYDDCWAYYNQCESGCGIPPAEDCLQRCDSYYYECQAFCAVCPKTIKTWVEQEVVSATETGNFRCSVFLGYRHPHEEYLTTKKFTTYKRVKDCCGTYTTTVTKIQYWTGLCYVPLTNYTCSPAVSPPACIIGF
jgi:hypothetical protein